MADGILRFDDILGATHLLITWRFIALAYLKTLIFLSVCISKYLSVSLALWDDICAETHIMLLQSCHSATLFDINGYCYPLGNKPIQYTQVNCWHCVVKYTVLSISHDISSLMNPEKMPHYSHVKARYGVCSLSSYSVQSFSFLPFILCSILCYIQP